MNKLELFMYSETLVYTNIINRLWIYSKNSIGKNILEPEVVMILDINCILMIDCTKEVLLIIIDMILIRSNHIDKDLWKLCESNLLRIAYNYKRITNFASKFKLESPKLILFYSEFKNRFDPRNCRINKNLVQIKQLHLWI